VFSDIFFSILLSSSKLLNHWGEFAVTYLCKPLAYLAWFLTPGATGIHGDE